MNKNNSHMKTLTRIFAGLAVLGALASCQMYEIDTQMTPEKAAASIRMECSAVDSYTLEAVNPESFTFNVSSNTPWTITLSSGADWLAVDPASSASSALISDVTVTAKSNLSGEDRQATLTLKGEKIAQTKIITVKQYRKGRLYVTPPAKDFSAAGGPLNFTIQTNVDWEVRCDQSWITFNRENGTPDPEGRTMTIIATAEPSDVLERTATITVVAGDDEESFDVSQIGSFSLTAISDPFESAGGSQTFNIKTDLSWEIVADQAWITVDQNSGTGDATITATATANDGAMRTANITVIAGGEDNIFAVSQKGFTFEIVVPASTELSGMGDEMILNVDTSIAWEPSTDVEGWSVEKIDASSFKVKAGINGLFVPKTGMVKITGGNAIAELELTQDIIFEFTNCDIQEDGSVKLSGDKGSRVKFKEGLRMFTLTLTMGEKSFGDAGQLWVQGAIGSVNIYNQLSLGGNTRIRTDGNMADEGASSAYKSSTYSISKDELNGMNTYEYGIKPNAEDPTQMDMWFYVNGAEKKAHTGPNPFYYDNNSVAYYFGFYSTTSDGSWYVVKSCNVVVNEENYL